MKTGVELIAEERQRQIEVEEWTEENDDQHTAGELALAAASYALSGVEVFAERPLGADIKRLFPWAHSWFKPYDRIRDLARAGALIAAEIDRQQRKS